MSEAAVPDMRAAGWLLAGSAVLSIALMVQHPTGEEHGSIMTPIVHGGLQTLILAQLAALIVIAQRLGWSLLVVGALIAFAAGQAAGIGAATINGFVMPSMARHAAEAVDPAIAQFAWETNQALARFGAVMTSAAFVLFAWPMMQTGWRVLGGAGALVGVATLAGIHSGHLGMAFHGAILTYVTQSVWLAALGFAATRKA